MIAVLVAAGVLFMGALVVVVGVDTLMKPAEQRPENDGSE